MIVLFLFISCSQEAIVATQNETIELVRNGLSGEYIMSIRYTTGTKVKIWYNDEIDKVWIYDPDEYDITYKNKALEKVLDRLN